LWQSLESPALPLTAWQLLSSTIVSLPAISMAALSWVPALQSLPQPQVKIASLPPLALPYRRYAMQQVNLPSSIAVKAISVSVLQSLRDFQVYAIQCQLEHH
jgi:hypothetical protein